MKVGVSYNVFDGEDVQPETSAEVESPEQEEN